MTRAIAITLGVALVLFLLPSVVAAFIDPDPTYQLAHPDHVPSFAVGFEAVDHVPHHPVGIATTLVAAKRRRNPPGDVNGHPCGGDLPPCSVLRRETGGTGDPASYNPTGCYHPDDGTSGCYGKWQCDPRTCDGTGTEAEQDAEARRVWDDGRGCSHWDACGAAA